ncbi:MAG: hypothetical protein US30_C0004G0022 [Candidatus Moranbacteria bacterium GW2011_GWF2_36_839]|nr:MAG: hypothetical protein US27_C0002G0025 [Candidatus Moranbacteria bacterium GW2011_GWF1_36_78]KKQ17278.1 MAG: hypothetical protein US30_C0004G0022 [Candidatus Moranbacteria bacterium GW2011_GWF2_36_839]HAT73879.1 hypothetical protein [Candidatus Moranbacteria bacterium]HBY10978.1 hypothetical protein [Candidatus Moranbacteria bacterium]
MAKKKVDKKISSLEASFEDVLVCQKTSAKTLLEIFVERPENITQENLGILAGILEINEESSDSSYVVNYLISVIKKEYYSKAKRGAIESFEAALNKANLALAKLAEHGNVNWLGKINAILLVIEKNNIHLSQAGSAKALLLRGKSLTDISEGAIIPENPSPFKTFIDVLSGRLEKDDALIVTTDAIFEIFSFEEIKRSALKFSPEEFMRFLRTALGNELEKAAVLVARMEEKKSPAEISMETAEKNDFNAFSQTAFSKAPSKKPKKEISENEEKKSLADEIKEDLKKESDEFIDKKTGHIYIKENFSFQEKNPFLENISEIIEMKISEFFSFCSKKIATLGRKIASIKLPSKKATSSEDALNSLREEENIPEETGNISPTPISTPVTPEKPRKPIIKIDKEKIFLLTKEFFATLKEISLDIFSFLVFTGQKTIAGVKKFIPQKQTASAARKTVPAQQNTFLKIFIPRFGNIKKLFLKLDYSQKLYAGLAILLLLIIPYFIAKIQNKENVDDSASQETAPSAPLALEQDKNVSRIEKLQIVFSKNNLFKIINLNGKMFFVYENSLTSAEDNQNYPFPAEFAPLKIVSNMDDLNLIFLMSQNNRIISWSPISKKFQDNAIEIPAGSDIALAKTYLTYLYLLDKNSNQIYRYPRANEGFGEKTNWLKDTIDLNKISDIAIGENLYLAQDGNILKLFQGKKQIFSIEETATPIYVDKLYTKRDSSNFYALDKKNSRIVKFDLDGKIVSQFYNAEISQAQDFEINEESSLVYFSNGNEVKSFEMK